MRSEQTQMASKLTHKSKVSPILFYQLLPAMHGFRDIYKFSESAMSGSNIIGTWTWMRSKSNRRRPWSVRRMCLPLTVQHIMIDCVEFAYTKPFFSMSETWKISSIQLHLQQSYCTLELLDFFSRCDLTSYLGLCTRLTITFFSSGLCLNRLIG